VEKRFFSLHSPRALLRLAARCFKASLDITVLRDVAGRWHAQRHVQMQHEMQQKEEEEVKVEQEEHM
jgi:hypothetical protein